MKYAYITGATGAIGMALTAALLSKGTAVTVYVRRDSKRIAQMNVFKQERFEGRLRIEYAALSELAGCDADRAAVCGDGVFYHLGWSGTFGVSRNDRALQQKNVEYTMEAARLAARLGCRAFVGAGSQAEYGRARGTLTPDMPAGPENEYGRAKLAAGEASRKLCAELGMRHCWVRILSVYGPYDGADTMIMSVIRSLLAGQEAELTAGGQIWDYLYSEDAAEALYRIGELKTRVSGNGTMQEESPLDRRIQAREDAGGIYCLGSGRGRPLKEYILELCRAAGADERQLRFGAVPYEPSQVMELTADIASLTKDTGFVPKIDFDEGIRRTIQWYRGR